MHEYKIDKLNSYMRYQDFQGEKTPIIFIHGLGCAGSFDYPDVAAKKELCNHRRIIVDLLGAGYSDKPDDFDYSVTSHAKYLKEFLENLNIKRVIIYGHSLGGAVAIELAKLCGDMVENLVLAESNLDKSTEGASSFEITRVPEDQFLKTGFKNLIKESRESGNTMWAATLSNWLKVAAYRFSMSAVRGGTPSWRETLYSLKTRKTFIFGENSLPDKDVDTLKNHGINIEIVPKAGHSMAWENPEGVYSFIFI